MEIGFGSNRIVMRKSFGARIVMLMEWDMIRQDIDEIEHGYEYEHEQGVNRNSLVIKGDTAVNVNVDVINHRVFGSQGIGMIVLPNQMSRNLLFLAHFPFPFPSPFPSPFPCPFPSPSFFSYSITLMAWLLLYGSFE